MDSQGGGDTAAGRHDVASTAMDLVLCGIDAETGQVWFGPWLSYTLPLAELADLEAAGRIAVRPGRLAQLNLPDMTPTGDPLADATLAELAVKRPPPWPWPFNVAWWVGWRGPYRIDPYLEAATAAGVLVVTDGTLTVLDPDRVQAAARRLIAVLEDPDPARGDVTFAVLAAAARVARPHLRGRDHRMHRARLRRLRRQAVRDDPVLRAGCRAIPALARSASGDWRSFDQRVGYSGSARGGASWL